MPTLVVNKPMLRTLRFQLDDHLFIYMKYAIWMPTSAVFYQVWITVSIKRRYLIIFLSYFFLFATIYHFQNIIHIHIAAFSPALNLTNKYFFGNSPMDFEKTGISFNNKSLMNIVTMFLRSIILSRWVCDNHFTKQFCVDSSIWILFIRFAFCNHHIMDTFYTDHNLLSQVRRVLFLMNDHSIGIKLCLFQDS